MKNKGFTLVELLAVIVILGIILAIAIPGITGIIGNATKSSFESDAKMLLRQLDLKKAENDNFNVLSTNVGTIGSFGLSTDNYQNLAVSRVGNSNRIFISGKNKWAGLKACGSYNNMIVTDGNECDSYASSLAVTTFEGGEENQYFDVKSVADGYIVVGRSDDYDAGTNDEAVIKKYDLSNNVVWTKTYSIGDYTYFYRVVAVSDGYVAIGRVYGDDGEDAIIVKYDLNGNLVWDKSYDNGKGDGFDSIISVADGYIVSGETQFDDYYDALIVKYDLDGNFVWDTTYGGDESDYFSGVVSVADGYVVSGQRTYGNYDAVIVKFDLNGDFVWESVFGGSGYDVFRSLVGVADGYVTVGESTSNDGHLVGLNKGSYDAIIVKYDLNGNIVWKKNYGGSGYDSFSDIKVISTGFIVGGVCWSTDGDVSELNTEDSSGIAVRYDQNGNVTWSNNYGQTDYSIISTISVRSDTDVAFAIVLD